MGLRERLTMVWERLREPRAKPEFVERLEERQNAVAVRLSRLASTGEAFERADRALRHR